MKIIHSRPPNFEQIQRVFPMAMGDGVIFAYAPDIYVPSGKELPPELLEHESVHIERQLKIGVQAWWDLYLTDDDFRYEEELLSHRAEYNKLCELYPNRRQRRYFLQYVAKKLSSPLYGKMKTTQQCVEDLRRE